MPEPLPTHVKVKLGFEFVDFANSKLQGQDTLIFFVDRDTETILSLMDKVAARLDYSPGTIILNHVQRNHCMGDYKDRLYEIDVASGDSFKCHQANSEMQSLLKELKTSDM